MRSFIAGESIVSVPSELRWAYEPALDAVSELVPDQRLISAAEALLHQIASTRREPDRRERISAMWNQGIAEPVPFLLVLSNPQNDRESQISTLTEELSNRCQEIGCNRIGIASRTDVGHETLVVLAMASRLHLDAVPQTLEVGQNIALTGHSTVETSRIEVVISTPDGEIQTLESVGDTRFDLSFTPPEQGPYRFEIIGTIDNSPTVLALFSVNVGQNTDSFFLEPPSGDTSDPNRAIARLLDLVNHSRSQNNIEALESHDLLGRAAQNHAEAMSADNFFSHRDSRGAGPEDRVAQVGIASPLVLENLSVASSAEQAFANICESPAHLRAMLNPETTHIGVGVHRSEDDDLRVVVLMVNIPPLIDIDLATRRVVEAIEAARQQRNVPTLTREPAMDEAADEAAEIMATMAHEGASPNDARRAARVLLASRHLPALSAVMMTTNHLEEAARINLATDPTIARAGIAVRQAQNPIDGYHVVLLLAR